MYAAGVPRAADGRASEHDKDIVSPQHASMSVYISRGFAWRWHSALPTECRPNAKKTER